MKIFVIAVCLIVLSSAAPPPAAKHEEIHDEYGQYALRYITVDGTIVSERGRLIPNEDGTDYVMVTEGETSYRAPDGNIITTRYTAGPDGAHFEGDHLPKSPELPAELQ